jgi:hypothetical protein
MSYGRRLLIVTNYDYPPIPIRNMDWSAVTDNYEPGEPIGHGPTEADAVMDLFIQIAEREDDDEERYRHETA